MVGSIFDCYIFWACEIALKIDDFEILDIQMEKIGLLLVYYGKFLSYFDAGIEFPYLLFV